MKGIHWGWSMGVGILLGYFIVPSLIGWVQARIG